jgi:hypothetical protein
VIAEQDHGGRRSERPGRSGQPSRALRKAERIEGENRVARGGSLPTLVAESPAMRDVVSLIDRVAPSGLSRSALYRRIERYDIC